jgi:hypothetical protein
VEPVVKPTTYVVGFFNGKFCNVVVKNTQVLRIYSCCFVWQSAEEGETTMNWFERHPNWITGIFGYFLVLILCLLYLAPSGALARNFINNLTISLADFRLEPEEWNFYHRVFTYTYFVPVFSLYLGMNIWYLRVKGLSYKYLGWLGLILIPACISLLYRPLNMDSLFHSGQTQLIFATALALIFPVSFILSAIMMLRLKNNNVRS